MAALCTFLALLMPLVCVSLCLGRRDRAIIAKFSIEQASAFAKEAGLFVPPKPRIMVPCIERVFGGEHCDLIDKELGLSIGKVHHRPGDWFGPADRSLHSDKTPIRIETRVQLNPYGAIVTLKNVDLTEGRAFMTPDPEGAVGMTAECGVLNLSGEEHYTIRTEES